MTVRKEGLDHLQKREEAAFAVSSFPFASKYFGGAR